jgi:hypothetical protein
LRLLKSLIHAPAAVLYTQIQQLCTGLFNVPVGLVGKTGPNSRVIHHFSKTAEMHSWVLENSAPGQPL